MRIIEPGTRKQGDFVEKIIKSAWKRWLALAVILLLVAGGIVLIKFFPLVFSYYDFIFIGLFIVVAIYLFIQWQRIK